VQNSLCVQVLRSPVFQTLRRSAEGATYIRQGGRHVGHRPTFYFQKVSRNFRRDCIHDQYIYATRMLSNAQRDGRPAGHKWRPLFNAAKFGWRPLLDCRAVTLSIRETRWNHLGCPKLVNRSQPLVGLSLSYCEDMWRRYCCLTGFFSDCGYVP